MVEHLDQRPHEKRGNQGAHPRQQPGKGADGHADQVAADAHKPEGPPPFLRDDNGDGVIDRDPQVGGHVEGRGKAHNQNPHRQKDNAGKQARCGEQAVDGPHAEVHNISCQEHVHQGGNSHVAAGNQQVQGQHQPAEHHIIHPIAGKAFKETPPHALGKALKGVHPKAGAFKKAHSNGA